MIKEKLKESVREGITQNMCVHSKSRVQMYPCINTIIMLKICNISSCTDIIGHVTSNHNK